MEEQLKQHENQDDAMITRSIRAKEGSFEKFKSLSASFGSQADLFDTLLQFYENRMATENAGRQTEINNFEMHVSALLKAYSYSLDLNRDAEERINGQYIDALKSKDSIIFDLQQKMALLDGEMNTSKSVNQELSNTISTLNDEAKDLVAKESAFVSQLADKDKLIASLEDKIATSNNTIASLVNEAETQRAALTELKDTIAERDHLSIALAQAQNEIAEMQSNCDAKLQQAELSKKEALIEAQGAAYQESKQYLEEIAALKNVIMELKLATFEKEQPANV